MKKTVIAAVLMSAFSVCTVAHAADANLEDRLSKIEGMDRFQNYTLEAYKKEIENNKTIATNAQNNAAHAIIKNSEQDSSIEANKQSIEKNTAGIAANKQSIEKNTAGIAAHEDRLNKIEGMDRFQNYTLEAYKKEIENNKTIATNAQNNAAHAIIKNSEQDSSIEANKQSIEKNTADIAANKQSIENNTADIAANKQSIEKNTAGIAANKQSIEKNTADIAANKEAIKFNHETNIRQDQDIQSNKVAISNNRQAIQNVAHQVDALKSRVDDLSDETYKGLAAQAALSGLFQPYSVGKFNVTAALGGYKSEQAVAIGSGYRFNENVAVKAAVASDVGFDAVSYNVGVNFEW